MCKDSIRAAIETLLMLSLVHPGTNEFYHDTCLGLLPSELQLQLFRFVAAAEESSVPDEPRHGM